MSEIELSIVIVNYNTRELTLQCIESIVENTKELKYEIILVDNNSTDGSVQALKRFRREHKKGLQNLLIRESKKNLGFAGGNNLGLDGARGNYVLFLNSDTLIQDNVLTEILKWMNAHKEVGIASCALTNKDGSMQGTGGYFPSLLRVFNWMVLQDFPGIGGVIKPFHPMQEKLRKDRKFYQKEREMDWLKGAFLLTRKSVVDEVRWDNKYFMYTEDVDFCFRARKKGWKVWYVPKWSVVHYGGASGTKETTVLREFEGIKRFYKMHYPKWQYPVLRLILKIGAFGRMVLFSILEGRGVGKIYAKAFVEA